MDIVVVLVGLIIGVVLSVIINKISYNIHIRQSGEGNCEKKEPIKFRMVRNFVKEIILFKITTKSIFVILICGVLFIISFRKIGMNIVFLQTVILDCILVVISFIDIEHKIIPNKIVIFTLIMGCVYYLTGNISLLNALGGMAVGGGILFILALIPNAMGGGDIKLMFVLGMFLGYKKSLIALILAFILAAIISVILLMVKIKERKEYIPFGPFLAIGSFIAFHWKILF